MARVEKSVSLHDGVHEVVGDADGVVGVLEEDGRIGFRVGRRSVVSGGDQGVGLGFFFALALDEVDDVRVVDVEDDHLGGAASLAARLDDAGEGVKSLHEAERTAGGASAAELFGGRAQRGKIGAGAAAPLEEHAFGLGESEDGVERIFYRVDEAGRALRRAVSGDAEFDAADGGIPVPVLRVGVGLDAVAAYVEPDGRIESRILADQDVRELVVECCAVFGRGEVALRHSPVANGFGDAGNERADTGFALGRADGAVQIFAGHDVGRRHGPIFGSLDVFLLENYVAFGVGDLRQAKFPFDLVIGRDAGLGEKTVEAQAGSFLGCVWRRFRGLRLGKRFSR